MSKPMPAVDTIRIDVASSRGTYPVLVGAGTLSTLPRLLTELNLGDAATVVSCSPVWRLHARRLRGVRAARNPVLIPDGERAKTLATVARIYDALLARRMDRSATLLAFGGGVVGDVAGFAAASYLRGIPLVQIPTTVLAQVDSAIGGKVGVNLPKGKNLVGAFHPASLVVCDPAVLASLSAREFRSGFYEVVKYGVIASRPLFDRVARNLAALFARDPAVLTPVIAECCAIKADVVGRDEREAGPRRALNFGHTVGHALEALTRYRRFRHGEAVGWGMLAAARLSVMRGLLHSDDEARLQTLIAAMGRLPSVSDLRVSDALDAIGHDKKVSKGRLHFVLANGIGSTATVDDVSARELTAAMRSIGMRLT
jgi:3-dehydroquinate synthase